MRSLNSKRGKAKSSRKIAIFLLLAYFAMGAGLAGSSVLCLGEDGHLAVEFAASCTSCGVRTIPPVQPESLIPGENPVPDCGPCQDLSITSASGYCGIVVPAPHSRSDKSGIALPSIAPAHGFPALIVSSVSGPSDLPNPIAFHARTVVLLI